MDKSRPQTTAVTVTDTVVTLKLSFFPGQLGLLIFHQLKYYMVLPWIQEGIDILIQSKGRTVEERINLLLLL